MRPFAKVFYSSKEWKTVRDYCMKRDHYECIKCGKPAEEVHHIIYLNSQNINDVSISLNPNNLVCLCRDCHFDTHRNYNIERAKNAAKKRKHNRITREDGTYFDEYGMLMKRKAHIVYGSPRSGKSTYVREHMEEGDVVIDIDSIISALQYSDERKPDNNLQFLAVNIRDYLINELENNNSNFDCKNVWIIGGFPNKQQREDIAQKIKADLIFIKVTYKEAIDRAKNDNLYGDIEYAKDVVDEWWKKYQA